MADLQLALPWVAIDEQQLGNLVFHRGSQSMLTYEDGITLAVRVLEPARFETVDDLISEAERDLRPGQVVLVAGSVPLAWRGRLRAARVSFVDVSGIVNIDWPRVRVRASRVGHEVKRRRDPLPLQKGYARVTQVLLIDALAGSRPTIGEIAEAADSSPSSASRAIDELASHGLVSKQRHGRSVRVSVVDTVELAALLADRTAWVAGSTLRGYSWGSSVWDQGSRLSERADREGVDLALTGRAGAAFLGVVGTSSPTTLRCWVSGTRPLVQVAELLDVEPAQPDEANLELAADTWGIGLHRATRRRVDDWSAKIAHPVRVWCDLHAEQRGAEFADQLWSGLSHAG